MIYVDVFEFWVLAIVLFAFLSLMFAPDSRDTQRAVDRAGSWAALSS